MAETRDKELRLALVCYGGISLAVYMHGITKEIWRLATASCGAREGDEVGGVYRALLDEIRDDKVGNVHAPPHHGTYCPSCRKLLIERQGYDLAGYQMQGNQCGHCGTRIAGHFDTAPGTGGSRRMPVGASVLPTLAAATVSSSWSVSTSGRPE